jgi:hypothetical protein
MGRTRARSGALIDRTEVPIRFPASSLTGWVAGSADLTSFVPVDRAGMAQMRDITAETLATVGLQASDRVVVALNMDGACVGANWAESASQVAGLASTAPVNWPLRVVQTLGALSACVLVTNPTTAWRVARAMRSVGRDPVDFRLRLLVLTGEILRRSDLERLSTAFQTNVVETWSDPLFGVALAVGEAGHKYSRFKPVRPGILDTTPTQVAQFASSGIAVHEWTFVPTWCQQLRHRAVRSGVAGSAGSRSAFEQRWTIGRNLLVRGRWLDLHSFDRLAGAGGAGAWSLEVARSLHSDRATLLIPADNANPLRMAEQLASLPIRIGIRSVPSHAMPVTKVVDRRRQHLGPKTGEQLGAEPSVG